VSRVLEDAALAIGALGWVLKEVLADGGEVLSAETLLLLELLLAVSEATTLLLLTIFALKALEPEAAKLSLDLLLPAVLEVLVAHRHVRLLASHAVNGRLESIEAVEVVRELAIAVTIGGAVGRLGHGRALITVHA